MQDRCTPSTEYGFLDDALDASDAGAYVHVGDRFDDSLRYLTRFAGPDRDFAFVYAGGEAVLCPPRLFDEQAEREFVGDATITLSEQAATDALGRAVEVLRDRDVAGLVLVPEGSAHETVAGLEAAGFDVETTDAVVDRRERKSLFEHVRLAAVEAAAQEGLARAEAVLASATVDGGDVVWRGEPLTTERLRREVNRVLAGLGIQDAGNTVIGVGPSCADLHFTGTDDLRPDETVLIDVSPRGPHGYYGDVTRTFVVGEVREWERRAYDAVREAQDAALDVLSGGAGTRAAAVHEAVVETLGSHGYDSGAVDVGFYHGTGHGIGVSLHEAPILSAERPLEADAVVTVEPGVYDPARGGVRIEDVVVVTEDGYENLTNYPREIVPRSGRALVVDA